MKSLHTFFKQKLLDRRNYILPGLILSLILVLILFRLPEPSTFGGQNWRVELGLALFLIWFLRRFLVKNKFELKLFLPDKNYFKPIILLWVAFIIWSGISVFWAESWRGVSYHTLTWVIYFIFFFTSLFLIQKSQSRRPLITVFVVTTLILFTNSLVDFLTVEGLFASIKEPRIRYAKFAELLVTISPVFWVFTVYWKRENKFYFLTLGILSWSAVMLSLSKGAFIAGILAFIFCFGGVFLFSKKTFRKKIIAVASVWIIFTVLFQAGFSYYSSIPSTANFVSGSKEEKRESTSFRIFTWKVSIKMLAENSWAGVGANNFGIAFNETRKQFARDFPEDKGLNVAEDHLVERSHNEFLQIFAELGIIGGGIFSCLLFCSAFWIGKTFFKNKYRISPLAFGSLGGVLAFLISSLFSSFSFRLMQNGIVFLMVLAILIYELLKLNKRNKGKNIPFLYFLPNKPIIATALFFILLTGIFSGLGAVSNFYVYLGESESNTEKALTYFDKALTLNPENASAFFARGMRLYSEKRMSEATPNLHKSINLGLGTVISYSYLAEAYEKEGNLESAEKVLAENAAIFPHSIFARVRYAVVLEKLGKQNLSDKQMKIAEGIDKEHTRGWSNLIKFRSKKAYELFQKNKNSTQPSALRPRQANLQYLDKTILPKLAAK